MQSKSTSEMRAKGALRRQRLSRQVARRLSRLGLRSTLDLVTAGQDTTLPEEKRCEAIALIGIKAVLGRIRIPKQRIVKSLISILKTETPRLAWCCATSLGELADSAAVAPLKRIAKHANIVDVQKAAIYALGLLGDPEAEGVLTSVLADVGLHSKLRGQAAESLAYCRPVSNRAVSALIRALDDESSEVRFFSVFALGEIGNARAVPVLQRKLNDKAEVPGYGSVATEAAEVLESLVRRETRSQQ